MNKTFRLFTIATIVVMVLSACGGPGVPSSTPTIPLPTQESTRVIPTATAVLEKPQGEIIYALSDSTTEYWSTLWSLNIGESSPYQISGVAGAIDPTDDNVDWMKLLGGDIKVAFFVKKQSATSDSFNVMIYNRQDRTQPIVFKPNDPKMGDTGFILPLYWVSGDLKDQIYHYEIHQFDGILWYTNFSLNLNDQDPTKCRYGAKVHGSSDWGNLLISYQWVNEPCSSFNISSETYWGWEIADGENGKVLYQYGDAGFQEIARGWLNDHEIVIETFYPGINENGTYTSEQSCISVINLLAQEEATPYCQFSDPGGIGYVTTSPDGRFIAYVVNNELQVFDMQTPWNGVITTFEGYNDHGSIPIWSPDSQWIAFALNSNTNYPNGIYAMKFDGSGMQPLILLGDNVVSAYGWFPSLK